MSRRAAGHFTSPFLRPGAAAAVGAVLIWLLFAAAAGPAFRSMAGTASYLNAAAPLGILAVGVALLMIGGEFDLSVAGHDEAMIWEAFRIIDGLQLDPSRYEFQMLHGVDIELRRIILAAGHRLRVAVPFGPMWYPYSVRRLRKNPRIARYVLQALLKR